MLLVILMENKLLERFTKKNCENKSKSIYDRKRIKEKKGYMSNTKAMVICLIVGLTKKI